MYFFLVTQSLIFYGLFIYPIIIIYSIYLLIRIAYPTFGNLDFYNTIYFIIYYIYVIIINNFLDILCCFPVCLVKFFTQS